MYRAAQFVVRNKFVLIALAGGLFLLFGRGGEEQKPVNPWGSDSVQAAQASANRSVSDKAFGAVAGAAKSYAGVDISGVAPGKLARQSNDNWASAGEAAKRANGN